MNSKLKALRAKSAPINYGGMEVRADGKLSVKDRVIRGYAAVWGVIDSYGTVFIRGAFAKSIEERGPDSASKYKILMLWQHERHNPIGRVTVLREDDYGLYFEAEIDEIPEGDRALTQVNSGTINQFSFGFNYVWDKIEYNETLNIFEIREVELFEISPVTIGSNMETFALRSPEGREAVLAALLEDAEYFIRSIPRDKQLEARQLFNRYTALRQVTEPIEVRQPSLGDEQEPQTAGIDYNYLTQNL